MEIKGTLDGNRIKLAHHRLLSYPSLVWSPMFYKWQYLSPLTSREGDICQDLCSGKNRVKGMVLRARSQSMTTSYSLVKRSHVG